MDKEQTPVAQGDEVRDIDTKRLGISKRALIKGLFFTGHRQKFLLGQGLRIQTLFDRLN